ncbi:hypothetical protein [Nocardia asteroides]|uniref:hypothetical protein n=1 Tax=Nocardia asteroides TaxID=1824 RepID=UPI001E38E33D|nr:hypothetical protein [Nocardia asteroides]UGT56780.1 hypothetical protein LTT85_07965 [Nocardia asteroides]
MPFRHTAPPSAGRPSGMRSDRHESRPMTSESSRLVAEQHPGPTPPPAPPTSASTVPAHRDSAAAAAATATADRPSTPRRTADPSTGRHGAQRDPAVTAGPPPAALHRPGVWHRRAILRTLGGGAVAIPALAVLTACAEDDTVHAPDPLAAQEVLARADAAAAQAAIALAPQSQAALSTIAAERGAHADALRTEIDRVIGVYGDGTTPVHRTGEVLVPGPDGRSVPASVAATPTQPLTLAQLRDQLVRSQQSAATAARTQSGYRAGLLASISAACATQAGVLLT